MAHKKPLENVSDLAVEKDAEVASSDADLTEVHCEWSSKVCVIQHMAVVHLLLGQYTVVKLLVEAV